MLRGVPGAETPFAAAAGSVCPIAGHGAPGTAGTFVFVTLTVIALLCCAGFLVL